MRKHVEESVATGAAAGRGRRWWPRRTPAPGWCPFPPISLILKLSRPVFQSF